MIENRLHHLRKHVRALAIQRALIPRVYPLLPVSYHSSNGGSSPVVHPAFGTRNSRSSPPWKELSLLYPPTDSKIIPLNCHFGENGTMKGIGIYQPATFEWMIHLYHLFTFRRQEQQMVYPLEVVFIVKYNRPSQKRLLSRAKEEKIAEQLEQLVTRLMENGALSEDESGTTLIEISGTKALTTGTLKPFLNLTESVLHQIASVAEKKLSEIHPTEKRKLWGYFRGFHRVHLFRNPSILDYLSSLHLIVKKRNR